MARDITYVNLDTSFTQALMKEAPSFKPGQDVSFFASTSFLYSLAIMISVVAAAVMYARAGLWRMQGSSSKIQASNAEIKRTTLGLLGVLSLFVILYTFNRGLLEGDINLGALKASVGGGGGAVSAPASPVSGVTPPSGNASYSARKASHESVVARLAPSNIHTNYNDVPCTEAQFKEKKPKCTSLAFMKEETIQLLLRLNSSCKCTIVITGGTEPGHLSHGENERAVDLRLTGPRGDVNNPNPLYQYVRNTATNRLGGSGWCYEKYVLFGFQFCDEKPPNAQHFHVN